MLGRGPYSNLKGRGSRSSGPWPVVSRCHGCLCTWHTLHGVEIIRQGIDEFPCVEFLQQFNRQQLADFAPSETRLSVSWIHLTLLGELQAIGHKRIDGGSREVLCSDRLLHGLHQKLRHLGTSELFPGQVCLGPSLDDDSNCMGDAVDWERV